MKSIFYTLFIAMFLVACSDKETPPTSNASDNNDNQLPVVVETPCNPDTNTNTYINGQVLTYDYITAGERQAFYGEYGILGNGPMSDLRVEFNKPPKSGIYVTTGDPTNFNWKENQCAVNGTFGGTFSFHFNAAGGDSVYVYQLGEGKYKVDFCNLKFSAAGTPITFESKGSLTVE